MNNSSIVLSTVHRKRLSTASLSISKNRPCKKKKNSFKLNNYWNYTSYNNHTVKTVNGSKDEILGKELINSGICAALIEHVIYQFFLKKISE